MNAVATPARPKAKKTGTAKEADRTVPTASLTEVHTQPAFHALAEILADAHQTDEPHLWSGNSDRLLRLARDMAEEASKHPPSAADVEQLAFDIAALIVGARLIPGDTESPARFSLLQRAAGVLNWLTEECGDAGQDCCDPGADRPPLRGEIAKVACTATAGTATEPTGRDTFVSIAWYRAAEAEAVLRTYAEGGSDESVWGLLTIVEVATGILSTTHEVPTQVDCQNASNYLAQAIAIGGMLTDEIQSLLLDAALTVLVLAKQILDTGREEIANA